MRSYNHVIDITQTKDRTVTTFDTMLTHAFGRMGVMLLIAFSVSYLVFQSAIAIGLAAIFLVLVGSLGLIFRLHSSWSRLHYMTIVVGLLVFAGLQGIVLSTIRLSFATIGYAFGISAMLFFVMAGIGTTVSLRLDKRRTYMLGGLITLLLAGVVLAVLQAIGQSIPRASFAYSVVGVIFFAIFIMYNVNVLKQYSRMTNDTRIALVMAIQLFLSFINLFTFVLRLGQR